ncbi:MAG TPA: lytic transglycosylase domain-containing protein [Allosphingosinicella sp.]|nr:lytic transglycosylase domain-containing protein [Allosphingosinicella sp.]
MQRRAGLLLLMGASAAGVAAQSLAPAGAPASSPSALSAIGLMLQAATSPIAVDLAQWNSLRQSDNLSFSSYAGFLASHRGWPGETAMRRSAERRLSMEAVSPGDVARFFSQFPPLTAGGHAQHAFALQSTGRSGEARDAARKAWTGGVLPQTDEQRLVSSFGGAFGPEEHDRRLEVLLGNGDIQSAQRSLIWAPAGKRALFETRLALQTRAADASSRLAMLDPSLLRDPGLTVDRANWLRNTGQSAAARSLLAGRLRFDRPPANAEAWLETALTLARAAANDRNWQTAYDIASKVDDLYPAGTDVSDRPFAERDAYPSLVWLGGTTAFYRTNRFAEAARLFDLYARAARSPQTRAKGFYWAARAAARAGDTGRADAWLQQAAASPDQFYGLLALERLGRTPPPPVASPPADPAMRASFGRRSLVEAVRYLGMVGRRGDQTLFVRALAESLENDGERAVAAELGRSIGRLDLGVWAAREARNRGENFYARGAFPEVGIPAAYSHNWAAAHGIMRQESSFERSATSPVGARGMMQLMPATAAAEARRMGVPYNLSRLTEDPDYNILIGSNHLTRLLDNYGGNLILTAVAYNAGPGRVPQWIALNGDPRLPGTDALRWIEEIPFSETRNYVQRVVENAMVYDLLYPERSRSHGRISYYLGQNALR